MDVLFLLQTDITPKFTMGRLLATPGALEVLSENDIQTALTRHVQGDWGDLAPEDKQENDIAMTFGFRILSAYHSADDQTKFWIITEADRTSTTVLLPEEY